MALLFLVAALFVRITGIAILALIILVFFLTDILSWGFGLSEFWYRPYIIWTVVIIISAIMHNFFYPSNDR